jgi:hypothetical protein
VAHARGRLREARSIAVERGDLQGLEKRRTVIEKPLDDIDDKARWLAAHPEGTNYDMTPYRAILPVGVTRFEEFIPSRISRYWIDAWLRRALTPEELLDAVQDGSLRGAAANCPNSVPIG